jgi:hypothetical protein
LLETRKESRFKSFYRVDPFQSKFEVSGNNSEKTVNIFMCMPNNQIAQLYFLEDFLFNQIRYESQENFAFVVRSVVELKVQTGGRKPVLSV